MTKAVKGRKFVALALLSLTIGCGTEQAIALDSPKLQETKSSKNETCYSKAFAAVEQRFRKHYESDWYVDMRATVKKDRIDYISIHVGPYDGTLGGGFAAKYECTEDRLTTLESER